MRIVIQRVSEASVVVQDKEIAKIGKGILILFGCSKTDNSKTIKKWAKKCLDIKLFQGEGKTWATSVKDNNYDVLVVSQFTLYGILKGNKPDFHQSMNADDARILYNEFIQEMKRNYAKVQNGQFQEYMQVKLINDGPATILIEDEQDKAPKVVGVHSANEVS